MTPDRRVAPFRSWHYAWLGPAAENGKHQALPHATLNVLERSPTVSFIVLGRVVACVGAIEQWAGRWIGWAHFAVGALPHLSWITTETKARMAALQGRIEFTVRSDFAPGHRWAKSLGF